MASLFHFKSLTIDLGESYPCTSLPTTRGVGGRQQRAKEARGAKHSSPAGALSVLPHFKGFGAERARLGIFRGFGTERARLGTFRGFGTERARLGTFRSFGTERARLGTCRGFGTEHARLGTFNHFAS